MPEERNVDQVIRKFEDLKNMRANWDQHWQEIAERIWPMADEFLVKREPGTKRSYNMFDSTAALALEKFAAALESLLTPRAKKWHRLRASDEKLNDDPAVKRWFEEVNRILFATRDSPKANYYSQKHEGYKSLGAFGNDCLFVDERETGGIRYKYCHIGQVYIAVDHHGDVDTVYRLYEMSAKAAEQQWGEDALPPNVRTALKDKPFEKFEFLHCVMPRPDRDPELVGPEGMPWISLYIGMRDKTVIQEGGYHEMPYKYARYTINPMEVYGRSPAMLVLPSIKMLQEMQKTFIRAGHKLVDPPLLLHDDGVLGTGSQAVKLQMGGLNYGGLNGNGQEMIKALQTGGRLDITEGMMDKERETINDAFLVSLFQMFADAPPNMTATEVLQRAEEKGMLVAPTIGRQQSEMLGPQVEREVNILQRQGALPEMPDLLIEAEGEYEIEYTSDAQRFQRSSEMIGTDRTVERAMAFAQFDGGKALRTIKSDEVIRLSVEVEGAPQKILMTPEEVEQADAEAAQAEQAQVAMEQMAQLASTAKDAAQAESSGVPPGGATPTQPGVEAAL